MSFDVAAERYDAFMGRWSRPLAPLLADFAGVAASARVLDVGCGTGMLTAELVRRVGPALVSAVDPSAPFVAAMRERFPDIDVQEAGADALPYPDGVFDAVLPSSSCTSSRTPSAGLHEMRRVTPDLAASWPPASGTSPASAGPAPVLGRGPLDRPGRRRRVRSARAPARATWSSCSSSPG